MSETNETQNVTNSTNSTNSSNPTNSTNFNSSKNSIIEREKNLALKELLTAFQGQGLTSEELHFRFKCQNCGFRCCMHTQLNKVVFSPYSFAYMRKNIPHEIYQKILKGKLIKFSCTTPLLPVANINFMFCPFLTFHYNKEAKNMFQAHLNSGKNSLENEFQLFLVHFLHSLDTMYIEFRIQTSQKEPIMGILTPELIVIANKVWKRLTKDYSHLFFQKELSDYIIDLFNFLRNTPSGNIYFETSCRIYSARPKMCRSHPLDQKTTKEAKYTTENCLESKKHENLFSINYETCPSSAFTQGESLSAQQFLEHQGVQDQKYYFLYQVNSVLKQYSQLIQRLHPKGVKVFYKALIDLFYFTIEYQEDIETFYQLLQNQFDHFINNLNTIIETQ